MVCLQGHRMGGNRSTQSTELCGVKRPRLWRRGDHYLTDPMTIWIISGQEMNKQTYIRTYITQWSCEHQRCRFFRKLCPGENECVCVFITDIWGTLECKNYINISFFLRFWSNSFNLVLWNKYSKSSLHIFDRLFWSVAKWCVIKPIHRRLIEELSSYGSSTTWFKDLLYYTVSCW